MVCVVDLLFPIVLESRQALINHVPTYDLLVRLPTTAVVSTHKATKHTQTALVYSYIRTTYSYMPGYYPKLTLSYIIHGVHAVACRRYRPPLLWAVGGRANSSRRTQRSD